MVNNKVLDAIFETYIANFDFYNIPKEHCEYYKWVLSTNFKSKVDDAVSSSNDEISSRIAYLAEEEVSSNLIDNGYEWGLRGLAKSALYEPENVRAILKNFIADDGENLVVRQQKIANFVNACNGLKDKYSPESWLYKMSPRAAMAILAMYDPDKYYFYKSEQAHSFAARIGFIDKWGCGTNINLGIYYDMCDQIAGRIKNNDRMMKLIEARELIHKRGEYYPEIPLHSDSNLHLYVFDIIYCVERYKNPLPPALPPITPSDILPPDPNVQEYLKLLKQAELLAEAKAEFESFINDGTELNHSSFGFGRILHVEGWIAFIDFNKVGLKNIDMRVALEKHFVQIPGVNPKEWLEKYGGIINKDYDVRDHMKKLIEKWPILEEYSED